MLTKAIQETIEAKVKITKPRPDAKRWWNGELRKMKRELNKLKAKSYSFRVLADHPSHSELRTKSTQYGEAIIQAKRQHWTNYLEEMSAADIWTANKFIKEPAGDGGCPRIPTLKTRDAAGAEQTISTNDDKAEIFAKTFFPPSHPLRTNKRSSTTQNRCQTHPRSPKSRSEDTSPNFRPTKLMVRMGSPMWSYRSA